MHQDERAALFFSAVLMFALVVAVLMGLMAGILIERDRWHAEAAKRGLGEWRDVDSDGITAGWHWSAQERP